MTFAGHYYFQYNYSHWRGSSTVHRPNVFVSLGVIIGSTLNTSHVLTSHHRSALWNTSNSNTVQGSVYYPCTEDLWWDLNMWLVLQYHQLLPQPVNWTRPYSVWMLIIILQVIIPCTEDRYVHIRLIMSHCGSLQLCIYIMYEYTVQYPLIIGFSVMLVCCKM